MVSGGVLRPKTLRSKITLLKLRFKKYQKFGGPYSRGIQKRPLIGLMIVLRHFSKKCNCLHQKSKPSIDDSEKNTFFDNKLCFFSFDSARSLDLLCGALVLQPFGSSKVLLLGIVLFDGRTTCSFNMFKMSVDCSISSETRSGSGNL